jgi:glycosyltransferase involved in cell wall biosynthesis
VRIFLTCPSFAPHGGIRVLLEWANRLSERHTVLLRTEDKRPCTWFPLLPRVVVVRNDSQLHTCDTLIVGSPHAVRYLDLPHPARKFVFCQMAEHLFRPHDVAWQQACRRFYLAPVPMFAISQWTIDLFHKLGRTAPTYYVGNGVNLTHFPLERPDRTREWLTVLVEGWVPGNPSKDSDRLGPRVAERLRREGCRVLAYGQQPLDVAFRDVPHEYYVQPSLSRMNDLYRRATVLVKATHVDSRSCSPVEAMTKGTPTARAIEQGDDDLVHDVNCLRVGYDYDALLEATVELLHNRKRYQRLSDACVAHVSTHTWDYWMQEIEAKLLQAPEAPAKIPAGAREGAKTPSAAPTPTRARPPSPKRRFDPSPALSGAARGRP